jgi:hypothetical protein
MTERKTTATAYAGVFGEWPIAIQAGESRGTNSGNDLVASNGLV